MQFEIKWKLSDLQTSDREPVKCCDDNDKDEDISPIVNKVKIDNISPE